MRWLELGGRHEDDGGWLDGTARFLRHFHDPLREWDSAGFVAGPGIAWESAVRWMQRPDQDAHARGTGNWSWQRAQELFYTALTATAAREREQAFADLFRALGHVMHLVVDASVPEHVRNDNHAWEGLLREGTGIHGPGNYEYFLSDQHTDAASESRFIATYLSRPMKPDPALLREGSGDPVARASVARLIDTNRYTGADPNVTLTGPIGIAEVANANFLTKDTVWGDLLSNYPFPDVTRLVRAEIPDATGRIRAYFGKGEGDGLPAFPVAAECVLDRVAVQTSVPVEARVWCVDDEVWKQVAAEMLPRAVGYSTALLDYFFRGRLATTLRVYTESDQLHAEVTIANQTPDEDMAGSFELYYDRPDGTRQPLKSWVLTLGRAGSGISQSGLLTISPLPPDTPPTAWTLVFRGTLGQEEGVVVAARLGSRYVGSVLSYTDPQGVESSVFYEFGAYLGDWPYLAAVETRTLTGVGYPAYSTTDGIARFVTWSTRLRSWGVLYRDPTSATTRLEITVVTAQCGGSDSVYFGESGYRQFNRVTYEPVTAATLDLVEFEPPGTLTELYGYADQAPRVRQILVAGIGPYDAPRDVDIRDVSTLGLLLVSTPGTPAIPADIGPPGMPFVTSLRGCSGALFVRALD